MPHDHVRSLVAAYDGHYATPNFFRYRRWLYAPLIRSVARRAGLAPGARVLDLGCGQGFFTRLFAELGYDAHGVDLSPEGIRSAQVAHAGSGASFSVGDALALPTGAIYDCVYSRSCSLYNRDDFRELSWITDRFLEYAAPGGVAVFDYYTRPGAAHAADWRYHSLADVRAHFARYRGACTFFTLRLETILLGRHAFGEIQSRANVAAARALGLGGELIAIVRKP